ncbi:MAG: DUF11 domain-containing protein [Desulfobacteraceae bacterium]|nr:DUF11 domain-containing protein [Desulfobacteraceae bacterium]
MPNQGSSDITDSDADTNTGHTQPITLSPGEHNTTVDAGLISDDKITIGDLVWVDKNGDGVPSPGEGIPGVTVILLDGDGNVIATTVTDDDGHYHFTDLEPGDYTVVVDTDTLPDNVIPFRDPDGTPDSRTDLPGLNHDDLDVDFGYKPEPTDKPDLSGTTKSVTDVNGGTLMPGDTLMYAVVIHNSGDKPAQAVFYTDTPSPYTTLVPGSVSTTQGTVNIGNQPGDMQIRVSIGDIPAKQR